MSLDSWLQPSRILRCALIVGVSAFAVGCVQVTTFQTKPVDASSPIAGDVTSAARANLAFPKFAEIPAAPTDMRTPSDWRKAVVVMLRDKAVIETLAEANPASLFDAEGFAKKARARAAVKPGDATPAMTREDSEAFAKALRERATPPPPPQ